MVTTSVGTAPAPPPSPPARWRGGHPLALSEGVFVPTQGRHRRAAVFITHLVIGHDRNLGFSNVKKKAG